MRLIKKKFCSGDRSEARHTLKREEFFAHTATSAVLRNPNLIISSLSIHILSLQKNLLFQIISLITSPRKTSHMFSRLVRTKHLDIKVYQQAAGTMILLVYVGSIEWSNRLHKWNEEYEGRNRHNVECFFIEVYHISAGQTSLLQVQCEFYIGRVLCSILPEIRKTIWQCKLKINIRWN